MARSTFGRFYNNIRVVAGFSATEIADAKKSVKKAMEKAEAPRKARRRQAQVKKLETFKSRYVVGHPMARAISFHVKEALRVVAEDVSVMDIIDQAETAIEAADAGVEYDVPVAGTKGHMLSVFVQACSAVHGYKGLKGEEREWARNNAIDELESLIDSGEAKEQIVAEACAAIDAAMAWLSERGVDAESAAERNAAAMVIANVEGVEALSRSLEKGDPLAATLVATQATLEATKAAMAAMADSAAGVQSALSQEQMAQFVAMAVQAAVAAMGNGNIPQ